MLGQYHPQHQQTHSPELGDADPGQLGLELDNDPVVEMEAG